MADTKISRCNSNCHHEVDDDDGSGARLGIALREAMEKKQRMTQKATDRLLASKKSRTRRPLYPSHTQWPQWMARASDWLLPGHCSY